MATTLIAEKMEELRQKYGVTGRENGLYVGWAEGMTRRIARRISRKLARATKKQLRDESRGV